MRIALAQIKPITGDLEENTGQILRFIEQAKREKADIVVFPETAITGYCCGALFEQHDFLYENKRIVESVIAPVIPENMAVILGFIDVKGKNKKGYLDITDSAAFITGGRVCRIYDKMLLANNDHHEDKKYFIPGSETCVIQFGNESEKLNIGIGICEDFWNIYYETDVAARLKENGADIIISLNCSYFHFNKQRVRYELYKNHAVNLQIPVIAVNCAGTGDIVKNIMVYDGRSMAFNRFGELICETCSFDSDFRVADTRSRKEIVPVFQEKYAEIFDALVFEQREFFRVLRINNAQVHLSGGIDSAVAATIVCEAMGKEHSVFITNPTEHNHEKTRGYAAHIAAALDVKLYWNSAQLPFESLKKEFETAFSSPPSALSQSSMEAVLRTVQGISAAHFFKSGIVATGNHTEIVLGWATFHDIGSIGVHAPLGDLTKKEVFGIAEYINKRYNREIIPEALYNGEFMPAAELADSTFDPIDYRVMSGICAEMVRNRKSPARIIRDFSDKQLDPTLFDAGIYDDYTKNDFEAQVRDAYQRSRSSVFKCAQGAPVVIMSPRSRGFSNRETIINRHSGMLPEL